MSEASPPTTRSASPQDDAGNPLLQTNGLPRYDVIRPEHVVPAVKARVAEMTEALERLEQSAQPTWEGVAEPLSRIGRLYEQFWSPVGHLLAVRNSDALRAAHEQAQPEIVAFGLRMAQSKPLYDALKALHEGPTWETLSVAKQRAVQWRLIEADQAGVGLEGADRDRFNAIAQELNQIATTFSNHVLDATKAFELILTDPTSVEGWPASFRRLSAQSYTKAKKPDAAATPDAGPWRITLDGPSFGPFMQHHRGRAEREQVYRAFLTRASSGDLDNAPILHRIVALRREQAQLLGRNTYAQYSLETKMARSVEAVRRMFEQLLPPGLAAARNDLAEIEALAREMGHNEPLAHWDIAYYAERLRERRFDYTDEDLRPYFPLPRVLDGLFSLCERLFGTRFEPADGDAPVWNEDVRYFRVVGETGSTIAHFYLDPYSRPEDKRGGAWMNECLSRRVTEAGVRTPVVHLVCNGTPPVGETPSLMSFSEVETLFHEFGHGLQGMLTTVDVEDVSGLSGIEWDAVEIASQFMENWCYHQPTLVGMTQHVETGEPLPDELFEKIRRAKTFRAGSMLMRQLTFGMTDIALHQEYDPSGGRTAFDVYQEIAKTTSVLAPLPEDRFLCSFTHIFAGGYAAGYYSYKWSEVISADAFGAFEEVGLDNDDAVRTLGRKYRDTILAQGGSRPPMDVYRDFRGREPSVESLLRHNDLLPSSGEEAGSGVAAAP